MEPTKQHSQPHYPVAVEAMGTLAGVRPCTNCQFDLSSVPASASFCPRCGLSLQQQPALASPSQGSMPNPAGSIPPTFKPVDKDEVADGQPARSPILLGYASALYRLGARYEGGLGAGHNPDEAYRCYFKAAKLGNGPAKERLDSQD